MRERMKECLHKGMILLLVVLPLLSVLLVGVQLWNRYFFLSDLLLLVVFYALTVLGVTIGFHRMLTHQGFQAPWWVRGILLVFGTMACDGQPLSWASTHIAHHAHSDEEDDPHSPLQGFWHAHMGWLFSLKNYKKAQEYAPHLLQDPVVVFVNRTTIVWMALGLVIPFLLGGWTGLLWGGGVRIFLMSHVTWSVNSICHTFGRRPFVTTDESRNQWLVGLLAFGEGWHNNHHAFPRNAFHGMRWWQFDLSGLLIRSLEAMGLIWDVQRVAPETELAHRTRTQAMLTALADLRKAAMHSVHTARAEISALGGRFVHASMTDAQRSQCHQMQIYAMQRLDRIHDTIVQSAHLKRQKLAQYQKEAQALLQECQHKWAILVGERASA